MSQSHVRPTAWSLLEGKAVPHVRVTQPLYEAESLRVEALLTSNDIESPHHCGLVQNYLTDLKWADTVQPDLLSAMLPFAWAAWQNALLGGQCVDACSELNSLLFKKPDLLAQALDQRLLDRLLEFVRASLLFAVSSDRYRGGQQEWTPFWTSVSAYWPNMVAGVWDTLSGSSDPEHATSLLVYISRLAYQDADNVLLDRRDMPPPWAHATFDSDLCWGPEAVHSLEVRLDWPPTCALLDRLGQRLAGTPRATDYEMVISDIQGSREQVFVRRRSNLLRNLAKPGLANFWDDELDIG
jgi:hypothetical protein